MYKYFEYLKPLNLLKSNQFEWGYYNVYLLTSLKQTIIVVQAHFHTFLSGTCQGWGRALNLQYGTDVGLEFL